MPRWTLRSGAALLVCVWLVLHPTSAEALSCAIAETRNAGGTLRVVLAVSDPFGSGRFREMVDRGGTLYLRLQSDLWEDRPVWDKLVQPSIVTVFRILRDPASGAVTLQDSSGTTSSFKEFPRQLPLTFDAGPIAGLLDRARYYLHTQFTVGTVEPRDIEDVSEAVFGPDDRSTGLGALGKFVFRKILQVSDYLQSESCELSSRKFASADLRR
ncbi:MAG: hypothetical protein HYZ58_08125 [Acidobacteria bacterium]|nr:hypothetical protein [Acidobacteriota bacterium]